MSPVPSPHGFATLNRRGSFTIPQMSGYPVRLMKEVFAWAQQHQAVIVTFDEDFADRRSFPLGKHYGIIRLRIWPTTVEETQLALERLLREVSDQELCHALVIVGRTRIRVRPGGRKKS